MINPNQFRQHIIRDSLKPIRLWSEEAEELLMGTAAQESHLGTYIKQVNGPALGVFQMEPSTYKDIWSNFIQYRNLRNDLSSYSTCEPTEIITNMKLACIMARVHYLRVPEKLPAATDLDAQADYWKKYYNTLEGKGTTEEYAKNYLKFCRE